MPDRLETWIMSGGALRRPGRGTGTPPPVDPEPQPVGNTFGPARNLRIHHPYVWQSPWVLPRPANDTGVVFQPATSRATASMRLTTPFAPWVNLGSSSIYVNWGNAALAPVQIIDLRAPQRDGSVRVSLTGFGIADVPPPDPAKYYDNWAIVAEVDAAGKVIRWHDLFNALVVNTTATYTTGGVTRTATGPHITTDNHRVDNPLGNGLREGARAALTSGRAGLFTQDDTDRYLAYAAGDITLDEVATHSVAIALGSSALGSEDADWLTKWNAMKTAGTVTSSETWPAGTVSNQTNGKGWNNGQNWQGVSQRIQYVGQYPALNADASFDNDPVYSGGARMGTTVGIPQSVNLDDPVHGLNAAGKALAIYFQNYVGLVVDRASQFALFVDASSSGAWRNLLVTGSPTQMMRVQSMLRVIDNNTESTPNGAPIDALRCRPLAGPIL